MAARRPETRARTRGARLTRRGVAVLSFGAVMTVGAYVAHRSELLYPAALALGAPLIAYLWTRLRRLDLRVTRTFVPQLVAVGRPATVELKIRNLAGRRSPQAQWRDFRPWRGDGDDIGVLPSLASGAEARLHYELVPPRRGVEQIGPFSLELADPFRLAEGYLVAPETTPLVVTPDLVRWDDAGAGFAASEGGAALATRRATGGDDDLSTREYRSGDALRRVHWRASARHGELMVRQEEPNSRVGARVVLDTRASGFRETPWHRGELDAPDSIAFERSLALGASLALHLTRLGFDVELVETATPQLAPMLPVDRFMATLATLEPQLGTGADGTPVLDHPVASNRSAGTLFAVVGDDDLETIGDLMRHRHEYSRAVAFVIDPSDSRVHDALVNGGWRVIDVPVDADLAALWPAIDAAIGGRSGRR